MTKTLQNIGFAILVLVVSAGFYWLIFMNKSQKQDTLDYAMDLLGKKLMAMVQNDADKKPVQEMFDKFSQDARERKVDPEKIEYVAASILNLSNSESTLTPEEAETILNLPFIPLAKIESEPADSIALPIKKHKDLPGPPPPPPPDRSIPPEEWKELGERIKSLDEFNTELRRTIGNLTDHQKEMHRHLKFRIEKDLKIAMDAQLKAKLDQLKFGRLAKEMKRLERDRMLEWRENYEEELEKKLQLWNQKLDSLNELRQLDQLEIIHGMDQLKALESLRNLEKLHHLPMINPDSINAIIKHSLEEAGIDKK